jgi:hypothetical protein
VFHVEFLTVVVVLLVDVLVVVELELLVELEIEVEVLVLVRSVVPILLSQIKARFASHRRSCHSPICMSPSDMIKRTQLPPKPSKLGWPERQGGINRSTLLSSTHVTLCGSSLETLPPVQVCRTSAVSKSHTARKSCSAGALMPTSEASTS